MLQKLNYKDYPEFMFAIICGYLPSSEGDDLRRVSGNVVFRHEDKYGRTYKNGLLHSYDDKPANDINGCKVWYRNGKQHRCGDEPAYIHKFGNNSPVFVKKWYKNGELYRDGDKPAFMDVNWEEWWKNGKLHRDGDKPAVINGSRQEWYKDGKRHREGGLPAFIYGDFEIRELWVNGKKIEEGI